MLGGCLGLVSHFPFTSISLGVKQVLPECCAVRCRNKKLETYELITGEAISEIISNFKYISYSYNNDNK